MTDHYDALETREPAEREAELFSRLPDVLRKAMAAPAYAERLRGIDPAAVTSRAALARLPRAAQVRPPCPAQGRPAVRRLRPGPPGSFGRLFTSPGPIFEPEPTHADPWRGARALFAAGFRPGDVVLNTFSYHLTPGRLHLRRLGARARLRGDSGRSRQYRAQFELIEAYRPVGYSGTPDFLKILLDAADERRARRLLDQARAGVGRGVSEIAAGRDEVARHRCLSGVRHRRSRPDRVRDAGARGHGRQRGPDHGDRAARHRRSRRPRATSARSSSPRSTRITPGSASRSATSRRRCRAQARADAPTCASRAGWAAPTRPPRSRACSCGPSRSPRSASAIPNSGGCASS